MTIKNPSNPPHCLLLPTPRLLQSSLQPQQQQFASPRPGGGSPIPPYTAAPPQLCISSLQSIDLPAMCPTWARPCGGFPALPAHSLTHSLTLRLRRSALGSPVASHTHPILLKVRRPHSQALFLPFSTPFSHPAPRSALRDCISTARPLRAWPRNPHPRTPPPCLPCTHPTKH